MKARYSMNTEISIIPSENSVSEVEASIASFNQPLSDFLNSVGLPTEGILVPIEERRKVIFSLEELEPVPIDLTPPEKYGII